MRVRGTPVNNVRYNVVYTNVRVLSNGYKISDRK